MAAAREPDSAPADSAEGRALLQDRLVRLARIGFVLNLVFFPLGAVLRTMLGANHGGELSAVIRGSSVFHLGAIVVLLIFWRVLRRGAPSAPILHALDAGMVLSVTGIFTLMGFSGPPWMRPEMFVLFLVSSFLVLRAALVPSSGTRTAWVSALAFVPLLLGTYFFYRANPRPAPIPTATGFTAGIAMLALFSVVIATIVSRTVHHLRDRVREAMQLGQYTLDEKIGEGGMGVVWKARHAMLRRPTAIKLLPPERAGEQNLARFEREVQLTSLLTHPNTVAIYDYGRTPNGIFYYAMEYLDGLDLQTLVENDGPQDPARVSQLLVQVCGALQEAHGIGLVHRDIKPANILVCERAGTADVVKVLDFGLVKQLEGADGLRATQSVVGQIVGTPYYLSPEAITGGDALDGRSDLYALGAMAYFLLTGAPPFTGHTMVEICGHHLHTPVPPPSVRLGRPLPVKLEQLVMACLAKKPEDRPTDAAALREALLRSEAGSYEQEKALAWWKTRGRPLRDRLIDKRAQAHASVPPPPHKNRLTCAVCPRAA
jgi:serine/threonine protein kinase